MPRPTAHLQQESRTSALTTDLARLESRAYGIGEWAAGVLQRYHAQLASFSKEDAQALAHLHAWVFVPLTLWPFSITDLLHQCLQQVEKGQPLHPQLRLTIRLLPDVPDEVVCETVAEHERQVQRGNYENVVNTQSKFAQAEMALRVEPSFQSDWQTIKNTFDVKAFQDHKGVIRRTMDTERNLRPNFSINLQDPTETFRLAFDAFCLRWHLYGMIHDEPLLLKLSVNITPHSTMIIIPSFWSHDAKRDIRWSAVKALHGLRAPKKQGEALAERQEERMALAKRLHQWDAKAKEQNLKGEAKHLFLCQVLGLAEETSPKRLTRLRKDFPLR
jgi:hypothetical protein